MHHQFPSFGLRGFLILALLVFFSCKPERPKIPGNKQGQISRFRPEQAKGNAHKRKILQPLILPKEARSIILAKGDDLTITAGDFVDALLDQPLSLRVRYQNPDRWREFLMDLVAFELISRNAKEMNLQRDPVLLHNYKKAILEQHLRDLSERAVSPSDILNEEIDMAYQERPKLSTQPATANVYIYESRDYNQAMKTLAYLQAVDTDYADTSEEERANIRLERFKERVRELGPSYKLAETEGDAGFIGENGTSSAEDSNSQIVPTIVAKQIFQDLRPGSLYYDKEKNAPYRRIGFLIVGAITVSPSTQISKEVARTKIRNRLLAERRSVRQNEIKQDLLNRADTQIDQAAFEKIFGAASPPAPAKPRLTPIRQNTRPSLGIQHRTDLKRIKTLIEDNPKNAVRKDQAP